jgi:hypothetical protein
MDVETVLDAQKAINPIIDMIGKMGPHMLMILGINVIIMFFIRPFFRNGKGRWLPPIAVAMGVIFTPLFFKTSIITFDIPYPTVGLLFQGLLYGVAAVGIHAGFKQFLHKAGVSTGDTMEFKKEDVLPRGDLRP